MFRNFFTRRHKSRSYGLYQKVVQQARQPKVYQDFIIPDTPLGRFESIAVHLALILYRLKQKKTPSQTVLSQELCDHFTEDLTVSFRNMPISDLKVGTYVKKLLRGFYGRLLSYAQALEADNQDQLVQVLTRNVYGLGVMPPVSVVQKMAAYIQKASKKLDKIPMDLIFDETLFPEFESDRKRNETKQPLRSIA